MTKVLDHGYINLIEHWGSDERIVEAARMSTYKGFHGWGGQPCMTCHDAGRLNSRDGLWVDYDASVAARSCMCEGSGKTIGDERLLRHLYFHKPMHSSPFELAGCVVEVQAPIMVFREWHRHRTQSYNEMSARYTPLPDVNYMPSLDRCFMVSATNKQAGVAKGADVLTHEAALTWLEMLADVYDHAQRVYKVGLNIGIPKEVARLPVPVGRYSRMRAQALLANWLKFLTLRMDVDAQWEIRQFANALHEILVPLFPRTLALFDEGRLTG